MSKFSTLFVLLLLTISSLVAQEENSYTALSISTPENKSEPISFPSYNSFDSFQLVGGLVFVNGQIEGRNAKFILDTGSPGLILNKKPKSHSDQYIAAGLTGNTSIGETIVSELKVLNITKSNFKAYQMDLGHIENEILHKFDGLLGGDVFSEGILFLDYKNKKWAVKKELDKSDNILEMSFELVEHFLVLTVEVDNKMRRFVMDTGAEINLMDEKVFRSLNKSMIKSSSELAIQGASQENIGSPCAVIDAIYLNDKKFSEQTFSIVDFAFINEGLDNPFDGLIGFPFFENKKIAFDFEKEKIYLWE